MILFFLLLFPSVSISHTILYLNTYEATERREFITHQFNDENVNLIRISTVPKNEIDVNNFDVTIVEEHQISAGSGGFKNHMQQTYSKSEISLLLTYKKALRYLVEHFISPPYIIIEDDVVFKVNVSDLIKESLKAPSSWEVLQFYVLNTEVQKQFCNIEERFVLWLPEYFSTAVTMVKDEETAKKIIDSDYSGHHVLDSWLYTNFQTFTHTLNWFSTVQFKNRINHIQNQHEYTNCKQNSDFNSKLRFKNVCMAVTTTSTSRFYKDIYLKSIIPDHVILNVISRKNDVLVPSLHIYRWIQNIGKFSKWVYYKMLVDMHMMSGSAEFFEYYLFSDDDISFAGFPWITLNRRLHENPSVLGIPRESTWANSIIHLSEYQKMTKRDFFVHSNGDFWRQLSNPAPNRWSFIYDRSKTRHVHINKRKLNFLEQGCGFFSTKFFLWFMKNIEILVSKMQVLKSDWGVDMMWCGASQDYTNKSCEMFEWPVWHYDKGSLTSFYDSSMKHFERNGHKLIRFAGRNQTFKNWLSRGTEDIIIFSKINNFVPPFIA